MNTLQRVHKIVAQKLHVREAEITSETSLTGDLGADSLALTEIGMALEEEFDITLDDESFAEMTTVGKIVDWVEANRRSLV